MIEFLCCVQGKFCALSNHVEFLLSLLAFYGFFMYKNQLLIVDWCKIDTDPTTALSDRVFCSGNVCRLVRQCSLSKSWVTRSFFARAVISETKGCG